MSIVQLAGTTLQQAPPITVVELVAAAVIVVVTMGLAVFRRVR